MSSILSIDYGLKRVGVAFSDPGRIFSFPYGAIENKGFDYICEKIRDLILEKDVDLILVGVPFNMPEVKDQKSEMTRKVEEFISKLRLNIKDIKIETINERLSSFSAEENLREAGVSSKKSRKYIDAESARLMLEEFLQKKQ